MCGLAYIAYADRAAPEARADEKKQEEKTAEQKDAKKADEKKDEKDKNQKLKDCEAWARKVMGAVDSHYRVIIGTNCTVDR